MFWTAKFLLVWSRDKRGGMFETFQLRSRSTRQPLSQVISRPHPFYFFSKQPYFDGDNRPLIFQLLGEGSGSLGGPNV